VRPQILAERGEIGASLVTSVRAEPFPRERGREARENNPLITLRLAAPRPLNVGALRISRFEQGNQVSSELKLAVKHVARKAGGMLPKSG
jgi:hypothetical protein